MNYDNIPKFIKDTGQFCNWCYETRKGHKTKVPYNPITKCNACVDAPETFVDYMTVVDGQILPRAKEIVERFHNTYIEISPCGTGIRILALMSEGYTYDRSTYYIKKGNIEVYVSGATNCFVSLTGNVYQQACVTEQADAMQWLLDTHMKRKQPLNMVNLDLERDSYLSDESVLKKAMNAVNGEKFKKLWNADTTGYSSHSEAEHSVLCLHFTVTEIWNKWTGCFDNRHFIVTSGTNSEEQIPMTISQL